MGRGNIASNDNLGYCIQQAGLANLDVKLKLGFTNLSCLIIVGLMAITDHVNSQTMFDQSVSTLKFKSKHTPTYRQTELELDRKQIYKDLLRSLMVTAGIVVLMLIAYAYLQANRMV